MKRFLYYWLLVLGVALLFAGCTNEEEKAMASNELTVNIKVDDAVSVGKSRALNDANENKIANIHILAFNNATGAMISNGYTTVDNKSDVTLKLAIAAAQNTQLVVYAIANIGNPTLFDSHVLTRTDFENLYIKIDDADQMTAGTYSLCKADGSVFANVENETHAMLISQKQTSYQLIATSNIAVNLSMNRPMPKVILNLYGSNVTLVNYSFGNIPTSDAFLGNETNMTGVEYANTTKKAFDNNISSIEGITFYGLKSYKTANNNITTQRDRIDTNAPENAAYLDIIAAPVSNAEVRYRYRVYLGGVDASGAISPSEFSLLRNHDYYLNIILSDNISGDNRIKLDNTAIVLTPILEDWIDGGTIQYVARKEGGNPVVNTAKIGDFVFSDGTWGSIEDNPSKTPVAIIFSTTPSETDQAAGYTHGYAMALKNVHSSGTEVGTYTWAASGYTDVDNENLPNISSETWQTRSSDMDGYTNTTYLNTSNYPAGYAAKTTYASQVTAPTNSSGWFLPSSGQWFWILRNLGEIEREPEYSYCWSGNTTTNFTSSLAATAINTKLSAVGSDNYDAFFSNTSSSENYWSSSEFSSSRAYYAVFHSDGSMGFANYYNNKSGAYRVRAVLAF